MIKKSFKSIFISGLLLSSSIFASERVTEFEKFGARIVSITDSMTDEKKGTIFLEHGKYGKFYIAVYGSDSFTIWPNDNMLFADDANNLIRVEKNKPLALSVRRKGNSLKLKDGPKAQSIIEALVRGEEVKLRYYTWPEYTQVNTTLDLKNFSYIYNKASSLYNWNPLASSAVFPEVELYIYVPEGSELLKGSAHIHVVWNKKLNLEKNSNKDGGGASIRVGILKAFGFHKGKWFSGGQSTRNNFTRNRRRNQHLIIRDKNNDIVFKELLPERIRKNRIGKKKVLSRSYLFPQGEQAARLAWKHSPYGSIEMEGKYGAKKSLYGFKELWQWGIENAQFPSVE